MSDQPATESRGRPTDYRSDYCERVIELGAAGKSKAQMAAALGVCRQTLENWKNDHPAFLDAITRARDLSLAWWEDKGQENLLTSGFQTPLWSRSMAARFPDDYTERKQTELTGANGGPIKSEVALPADEAYRRLLDTRGAA
jgi:hypothetical protein